MNVKLWNMSARDNVNLYWFVGVLMFVGAVFGSLLVNALTFEQQMSLADEVNAYMTQARDSAGIGGAHAFWDSFAFHAKWLVLIWLLGLSVIGLPFVLALDFLKGVLVGFAIGLLVRQLAWKGVLLGVVALAPHNAIVLPALMIASISSARFAYYVVKDRLFRRTGRLLPPFLVHTGVAGAMLVMLAVAATMEAFVSPLLLEKTVEAISDGLPEADAIVFDRPADSG